MCRPENTVNKRGLAVVNMRNNSDISYFVNGVHADKDLSENGFIIIVIASISPHGAGFFLKEQFATWERRRPRRLGYGQWRKEPHACR